MCLIQIAYETWCCAGLWCCVTSVSLPDLEVVSHWYLCTDCSMRTLCHGSPSTLDLKVSLFNLLIFLLGLQVNCNMLMHCESKWVIWVGQITQTQHLSKDYKKSKWWCASAVPEGKSLMGKGMLLHQRGDADADRGHSWWLGVIEDEGDWSLEPSYSLGSARTNTELNRLK